MRVQIWKGVVIVVGVVSLLAAGPVWADEGDMVAIFKIKGAMPEAPDMMGMGALFGGEEPTNMFDLLKHLKHARGDKSLRACVFEIEDAALGLGQIQELRAQFKALRAADKDVLVYAETLHNGTLLLGSAASELVLMPRGEVAFIGMYGEGLYFKNLLEKIGLQADIIHCGAYKSAGEPLYRTGPSPEADEQTNRLLDSEFQQLLDEIADSRGLTPDRVRELVDVGLFSGKEALDAKLVDKLEYREQFIEGVKKRYGGGTKFVSDYGQKDKTTIDLADPFAFFKLFSNVMKGQKKSDKPAIAVVYVEGMITSGTNEPSLFGEAGARSGTIRKAIADAAADDSVKALILRVDSPGGSAIASEVICEATKRFKESGRPFIVSMGNVAGSGGYYVATQGDLIFAEPGTITGSIGVVGGKVVTKGLWDWVGVTSKEYKRGARSDIMNTNRPFDEAERKVIESTMTRVYDEFKGRVTSGRGKRIKGDLEPLAGGRVYTGKQALEIGLVDRLGGFADAIKHTAGEANLGSDYELRVFPRPKTIFDLIAEAFAGKEKENEFNSTRLGVKTLMGSRLGQAPTMAAAIETVRAVDPAKAEKIREMLIQVQLLADENVLLVAPDLMVRLP